MQDTTAESKAGRAPKRLRYNRAGQRLGRKGRDTRERILAAAAALIEAPGAGPLTLSAVAREAALGMSALYNYFNDLTELLLALLEPVALAAEDSYLKLLREPWPDDDLERHCTAFVEAYSRQWEQHSRLLHLRNTFSDQYDARVMMQRASTATPIITLLVIQMRHEPKTRMSPAMSMATALYMGLERAFTVATNERLRQVFPTEFAIDRQSLVRSQSRLLALGIRDLRAAR